MTLNWRFACAAVLAVLLADGPAVRAGVSVSVNAGPTNGGDSFNGIRTNFNGFESIPNSGTFYNNDGTIPYVEGGIQVQQVLPPTAPTGDDIWVTFFHPLDVLNASNLGWYPSGGDFGYTQITVADPNSTFLSVGLDVGTGFTDSTLGYELLYQGKVVALDSAPVVTLSNTNPNNVPPPVPPPPPTTYIQFTSDGTVKFDTILLQGLFLNDPNSPPQTSPDIDTSGTLINALAIDNISAITKTTNVVPEPASLVVWFIGAIGLISYAGCSRRNRVPQAV